MVEANEPTPEALERAKVVIFKAIEQNKTGPLATIFQHGFPIDAVVQPPGITALMLCTSIGSPEATALVLSLKPNVNVRDTIGRTAIHFACRRGSVEIFNLLVGIEDIDLDAQTNAGITPLMNAVHSGNIKLV